MAHTKRSKEFALRVARLREKLLSNTLDSQERAELAQVLILNTTDSACLVKAADDEPIFVLRGKDPVAAVTVGYWTDMAKAQDLHSEKTDDAFHCIDAMIAFRSKKES